jgi:hypothetical protein
MGLYFSMGNAGKKSNGHGKGKDERINLIDKDSIKSKDHISHAEKEEFRSVGRHDHHSPRNLVCRAYNSPILSHVRKHNIRSGVD